MTRSTEARDNKGIIPLQRKFALAALFACALACTAAAQNNEFSGTASVSGKASPHAALLTPREGSSVIAAALDRHLRRTPGVDCSHLVHTVYDRAGFSYAYADSSDLYRGTAPFRRVKHPQAGDLVVWPGHVGIVVNPRHHTFFSALSHGPGTAKYDDRYWRRRGTPRFYRYTKAEESRATYYPE
jgi:cell wall-associated NlpC family hydrolase